MRASQWRGVVAATLCMSVLAAGPADAGGKDGRPVPRAGKAIVGGGVADFASWPFEVAILRKGRLHCGGAVIAPTKILTAAHCALGFSVSQFAVVIGRATLSRSGTGQVIPVVSAAVHPDYANTRRHDVAVLTLDFATAAPALGLPTPEQGAAATIPGALLRVAGWGARSPFGSGIADTLRDTTERVRTGKRCRRTYRSFFSGPAMICAMGKRLRKFKRPPVHSTACFGDSGGPLVADTSAGPLAVGTVSYGGPVCGRGATPTVYSRVSESLAFIQAAL